MFCDHCQQKVSKTTFYMHKSLDQLSECAEEQDSLPLTEESDNALEDNNYYFECCEDDKADYEVTGGSTAAEVMDEAVSDMVSWSIAEFRFKKRGH